MSIGQIFDFIERQDELSRKGRYMNPNVNVLKIVDDFFASHTYTHTEESICICGCVENTRFFDLIDLPDNWFKKILEYCIEKKYIIIDNDFEHQLCKKLIRINVDDENIRVILWLIENFISTEKLNSFSFDYNYDTDEILEQSKIGKYPQEFYSLLQPFYNNQFYDETFLPLIFDVFRKKKFNFQEVSKSCSHSLLCSAIRNWDLYSIRELHQEKCEFDEECYSRVMGIVRRRLGHLKDDADESIIPKEHRDGSWSHSDAILYRELLKDTDMIKVIFQPHFLNSKQENDNLENLELIETIEKYVEDKFNILPKFNEMKKYMIEKVSSYHYRSYLVPNEKNLQCVYDILEYCVKLIKIDLNHECFEEQDEYSTKKKHQLEHPTLLNGYLYGSMAIEIIFSEWHGKFVELLTP